VIEKKSRKGINFSRGAVTDTTFLTAEEGGKFYWSEFFRWSLLVLVVNMECRQSRVLGSEEAGS